MPSPLLTAATSTFESLALLFAEAPPTAAQAEAPLTHAARVAFTGPRAGTLHVAVSDDVAVALAANMLGLDPDAVRGDEALRRDAVGELANVVCGNVLPLVAGREAVFHLAAPAACDPSDAAAPPAGALVEVLGVDDGRAAVTLSLDAPAAPRPLP
ncbi:chemotaxis protein CheX [Roseisolibacter sp. H3M3-2]|uniref:chemotaxis protein CheX n=1 Tax=Roseisolibacter sp. H3M3-2 TaxID=3031323 RepID=UPI0023D9986A|nr:chemotaxis protein CheX [Roseisolibacter sp. H3M3-2]MDF1504325.1 chemotaxis protein CheX [Roseisolibacter sp. H3M3-2]